jgi:hypothetical protein
MADIQKPIGPDVNIGASLMALEWALVGITTIVLGLRLFTVSVVLHRVQMADYLMVLAFVCPILNHRHPAFVMQEHLVLHGIDLRRSPRGIAHCQL